MTTKGRATATGLTTADPLRDDNQTSKGNGNVKSKTIVVKMGRVYKDAFWGMNESSLLAKAIENIRVTAPEIFGVRP